MGSYVLADAKGGAQAAAANSVASMKNMVARLEEQINNQEEEVNDLEGAINSNGSPQLEAALKSKRQELESSRALLKTVKAKLAEAKKAGSAATDDVSAYLLVGADDSAASLEKTVAQLEDKIKQLHGREQWINDHLPESKQDAAWRANTKEEDAYKAKLKAAKKQLANAQTAAVDSFVLADAKGGAHAAAANSASMKNTVARLELQINNQEEEVNDLEEAVNNNGSPQLEAALKSKRQELESSGAQLRAAKAKLASAQSADVESYVLADAKGGAQAATADSVASMKNTVARLEEQINNQEEEVNDLEEAVNSNGSPQLEAA